MKANRSQMLRDFVRANPGLTTREIADGMRKLGVDMNFELASSILSGDAYRATPCIRKEPAGEGDSGVPLFRYYYDDSGNLPRRTPASAGAKQRMRVWAKPAAPEKPTAPAAPTAAHEGYVPIQNRPLFIGEEVPVPQEVAPAQHTEVPDTLPAPTHEPMIDDLVELFAQAMSRRLMSRTRHYLAEELQRMLPSYDDHGAETTDLAALLGRITGPAEKKVKKPRVLIAGLLPQQAGLISQEFGEVFDLRFFEASGNLQKLKSMAAGTDYAISFVSKIGHGVEDAIKSVGAELTRCPGGMSALRQRLTEIYVSFSDKGKHDDLRN